MFCVISYVKLSRWRKTHNSIVVSYNYLNIVNKLAKFHVFCRWLSWSLVFGLTDDWHHHLSRSGTTLWHFPVPVPFCYAPGMCCGNLCCRQGTSLNELSLKPGIARFSKIIQSEILRIYDHLFIMYWCEKSIFQAKFSSEMIIFVWFAKSNYLGFKKKKNNLVK